MTSRALLLSATLAAALAAPAVQAQDLEPWGQTDLWDIMVDPTLGNGCLIQAEFDNNVVVRFGFDRTADAGYVLPFSSDWQGIEDGTVYPVSFDLDGEQYEGEGVGLFLGDLPGAIIHFDNPDFLFDIAARQTMTLFNEQGEVMSIDLSGTAEALEGMLACQEEIG